MIEFFIQKPQDAAAILFGGGIAAGVAVMTAILTGIL